jgi:hypothetical protein
MMPELAVTASFFYRFFSNLASMSGLILSLLMMEMAFAMISFLDYS